MADQPAKTQSTEMAQANPPSKTISDLFNDLPFRHFPAKHNIIYPGDPITRIYYIISGYVRMYNITDRGNEKTLFLLGPGSSFPLIQTPESIYYYDALTDVEVAHGTYEEIIKRYLSDYEYIGAARDSGADLMQTMMERMEVLAYDTAAEKIERMLYFLAKHYGEESNDGQRRISFKLTHQELANQVNVTRETVSQTLKKLQMKKIVKQGKDGYTYVKTPKETTE